MPKTPKASDGEVPKKPTRKTAAAAEDTTKVVKVAKPAAKSAKPRTVKPKTKPAAVPEPEILQPVAVAPAQKHVMPMTSIEERIRIRAYELYLRRGGRNGSPEQDWFQATAEVYAESVA